MPFFQAASAAAAAGMLGKKDGVAFHGRLLSIIGNMGRRKPLADKIPGMAAYHFHPFFLYIAFIRCFQLEPAAEW